MSQSFLLLLLLLLLLADASAKKFRKPRMDEEGV
eukprot:SAG31_NODE_23302_length_507_cov_0.629902_1_plen_33_part_01